MTNSAPITLAQVCRYLRKNPDGSYALPHQAAGIAELELDIQQNGYAAAMRRDRPWFATWSQAGKQPDPVVPTPQPVATRQEWLTKIKALNLSQPDAQTCQATCIAMAVRDANIGGIRRRLTALGSAGDPAVMRQVIRGYGVRYQYEGNACLQDVYGWLKAGEFLITHGWFTRSGHVICLDGLKIDSKATLLNVKDPWSEFNASAWAYNLGGSFYDGFYSDRLIYAACVAGVSADDASRIYQAGTVDLLRKGMWVHRFLV